MNKYTNRSRKISDGKQSGKFPKYVKRFVKNVKRFWKRNVKPVIRTASYAIVDKIYDLLNMMNRTGNQEVQVMQRKDSVSKKRKRRKILKIKIVSAGVALLVVVTSIAVTV